MTAAAGTPFHLVRTVDRGESFTTLRRLAARIHELRGDRDVRLGPARFSRHEGESVVAVSVRSGDGDLIGYAFFPDTPTYAGDNGRELLMVALLGLMTDARQGEAA